jgi:hypothetical protein
MRQLEFKNLTVRPATASIAAMTLLSLVLPFSANAAQPPRKGCYAVDKREYDSAKKQKLLNGRFGYYLRTGRVLRRSYWYSAPGTTPSR